MPYLHNKSSLKIVLCYVTLKCIFRPSLVRRLLRVYAETDLNPRRSDFAHVLPGVITTLVFLYNCASRIVRIINYVKYSSRFTSVVNWCFVFAMHDINNWAMLVSKTCPLSTGTCFWITKRKICSGKPRVKGATYFIGVATLSLNL